MKAQSLCSSSAALLINRRCWNMGLRDVKPVSRRLTAAQKGATQNPVFTANKRLCGREFDVRDIFFLMQM